MISPRDLRDYVIRPACNLLGLGGVPVEELLLGTAAQESNLGDHLDQVGGPALGLWQMEPATHDDLWKNFLSGRMELRDKVSMTLAQWPPRADQMRGNLYYACAMARVQYYRAPKAIPSAGDLPAQAAFYKQFYNTPSGAATVEQYVANAKRVL